MTEIVADKTVEVVKNAIETADGALDLYNKYLDQVIPWQTFDETIKELSRFKQEYSQAASVLVGDIKTLLMDSQDKYFEATQTVYEWCGVATQLLAAYIFLFDEYNEKKASAGFAPIFPDTCYHLTHYWLAAVDIPVASDNPVHYADAIRYNARTPLQGSLLPLTRLVWA